MSKWVVQYKLGTIVFMSPDMTERSKQECLKFINQQNKPSDYQLKEFAY